MADKPCMNVTYKSVTGYDIAVPEWEAALTGVVLSLIILFIIVGNILVILSVFTYKPLRNVQNFFIVSLAVADLTVAVLVLPLNVAYSIMGHWDFGIHVCKMWLTFDILCCTASILNLCAIALDRYWAITDPINYAQKRTLKRVVIMIAGVWVLSLLICSPPLLGWNDWDTASTCVCELTKQPGYVVYSSLGSFYIPLIIMVVVYAEIFVATRRRLRERAASSKLHMLKRTYAPPNPRQSMADVVEDHSTQPDVASSDSVEEIERENKQNTKTAETNAEKKKVQLAPMLSRESLINTSETTPHDAAEADDGGKAKGMNQFIEEKQKISLSKERRAARTLGIIMGVFVVCWLPFFLMYVILPFCLERCPISKRVENFIVWLGYINSGLNPIIYTIFNLDFRRAFKKLLHLKP